MQGPGPLYLVFLCSTFEEKTNVITHNINCMESIWLTECGENKQFEIEKSVFEVEFDLYGHKHHGTYLF